MIDPKPAKIVQRPIFGGFKQIITFDTNSSNVVTFIVYSNALIDIYIPENVATWNITVNAVVVASNANPVKAFVQTGQSVILTITRANPSIAAKFVIGANTFSQVNTSMHLIDFANNPGGNGRYVYTVIGGTTVVCFDTNLFTLANLKSVTAIVNNGTSLTITVNGHGFSNGNTISLIDVGGFSSDINHKPWTISGVSTNTFDIPATVTGTWDTNGKLCGTWVTTPIIATVSLPTGTPTITWGTAFYRNVDKTLYIFGSKAGSTAGVVCTIDTDNTSGGFNTVKNWDKSLSNVFTDFGVNAQTYPDAAVYDSVRDKVFCESVSGLFTLNFGTATPTKSYQSGLRDFNTIFFAYDAAVAILNSGTTSLVFNPVLAGYNNVTGVQAAQYVYSRKYSAYFFKHNGNGMRKFSADSAQTILATISTIGSTWLSVGCAVDSIDKMYHFRANGSYSYPGTFDVMIWDTNLNDGTKEDTYIVCPGAGATAVTKGIYSFFSSKVFAFDNGAGASCRMHIFDTTRASGKKYIGYIPIGGSFNDSAINNLAWL